MFSNNGVPDGTLFSKAYGMLLGGSEGLVRGLVLVFFLLAEVGGIHFVDEEGVALVDY